MEDGPTFVRTLEEMNHCYEYTVHILGKFSYVSAMSGIISGITCGILALDQISTAEKSVVPRHGQELGPTHPYIRLARISDWPLLNQADMGSEGELEETSSAGNWSLGRTANLFLELIFPRRPGSENWNRLSLKKIWRVLKYEVVIAPNIEVDIEGALQ